MEYRWAFCCTFHSGWLLLVGWYHVGPIVKVDPFQVSVAAAAPANDIIFLKTWATRVLSLEIMRAYKVEMLPTKSPVHNFPHKFWAAIPRSWQSTIMQGRWWELYVFQLRDGCTGHIFNSDCHLYQNHPQKGEPWGISSHGAILAIGKFWAMGYIWQGSTWLPGSAWEICTAVA